MNKAGLLLKRTFPAVAGAAAAALLLAGCGGASVNQVAAAGDSSAAPCGAVNVAMNAWVGYTANAAVYSYVAKNQLGCTVNKKDLKEEVAWQGFETGQVDAVVEKPGPPGPEEEVHRGPEDAPWSAGETGNKGVIGWYVPPWMAKKYPDITDWNNLNKYAPNVQDRSESGGKGQLLDGDRSFVTNDEALVKNLKLDYKVVYAGSETALIQAFRKAEKDKEWVIGYFYEPQWFLSEVPLKKVSLPAWTKGCDAEPEKVACDYPVYTLNKIISTKFAESGSARSQSWPRASSGPTRTKMRWPRTSRAE